MENLKKAVTMCAIAFVFCFVNITLPVGGRVINFTPEFIGWLLFFLAYDKFGEYGRGNEYLKWAALALMVPSIVLYAIEIVKPEMEIQTLNTVLTILKAIYIFLIFGVLEIVSEGIGSTQTERIHTVRIVSLALNLLMPAVGMAVTRVDLSSAVIVLTGMLASLIVTFISLLVILKLRKEIAQL